jgi:hypothetical protein
MPQTKLTNGIDLYCCSMRKVFRVTHVCRSMEEANAIMEKRKDIGCIAEDNNGLVYLAEHYGAIAPSAILKDHQLSQ